MVKDINEDEITYCDDEPFDLDELLPSIGEFGKYQKLLLWFICLPACVPCGFCAFNQIFMADTPKDYWCRVPQLMNFSEEHKKLLSIPSFTENGEQVYDKCRRYAVDWDFILQEGNLESFMPNESLPTQHCDNGWEYNKTDVQSSIVIDYDLVCEKDIYPTLGLVALNIGGPIGVYFFGMLNDRYGRRFSYFSCLGTLLIGSFITAFSTNFGMWALSRIVVGLTIPAVYQIPFIIALELVGPNYRSFVTVMTCTFYTFGLMGLALVTVFVKDWFILSLVTSVPFLLYFLYIFIMPESPRWLLAKGKLEDALKILETMARINGKEFPETFHSKLEERVLQEKQRKSKRKDRTVGASDLCKTPNMRMKTFLITLNWFANETVYLGLSYYGPSLGSNPPLSFFLSSLVELPSYALCWFVMDRYGRRWPMCLLMILGGISCVITVLLPEDAEMGTLILYLISKSMICGSFLIIYPFAGELYPTQARGVGIGFSSYVGGLGLIIIPFITYLGKENLRLPLFIMGWLVTAGGFTGLRLPETLHSRLPQTIEEGEEYGKNWNYNDCLRCIPIETTLDSASGSYENLAAKEDIELSQVISFKTSTIDEKTPLEARRTERRQTMKKLMRQPSVMDTQKTGELGSMQLTYWF
ncbi:carcinine transporter [Chironomus tepperi]|uniref:carcinine transporter n=1 Tax=Chironomus tepperi TaxID=113505 RepID=UPI00391F57D6